MKIILPIVNHDQHINDLDLKNFLDFAKNYNIFQSEPHTKKYKNICDKIKARLDHEGLDYEIVRPE
jgi:hypothetical protein